MQERSRTIPGNFDPHAGIVNALTIDLEDYFQVSGFEDVIPQASWKSFESRVERNTERLLEILADSNVMATFFVLGWVAERHPQLVRCVQAAGHELGCHSYAHRLVYKCTPADFREDTRRAKGVLENLSGQRVLGYRAPSFSVTRKSLWALRVLAEEGFEYDSSIFPIFRDRYGIPSAPRFPFRILLGNGQAALNDLTPQTLNNSTDSKDSTDSRDSIIEFPPSTIRWLGMTFPVAGGGYLRLFPESVFHRAIQRIVEGDGKPVILYLHPWELDPDQPRIRNGSWLSRFRHMVNLDKTEQKLTGLLGRWRFSSLFNVLKGVPNLPVIPLSHIANQDRSPSSG